MIYIYYVTNHWDDYRFDLPIISRQVPATKLKSMRRKGWFFIRASASFVSSGRFLAELERTWN
jgi:hypothetical protein